MATRRREEEEEERKKERSEEEEKKLLPPIGPNVEFSELFDFVKQLSLIGKEQREIDEILVSHSKQANKKFTYYSSFLSFKGCSQSFCIDTI